MVLQRVPVVSKQSRALRDSLEDLFRDSVYGDKIADRIGDQQAAFWGLWERGTRYSCAAANRLDSDRQYNERRGRHYVGTFYFCVDRNPDGVISKRSIRGVSVDYLRSSGINLFFEESLTDYEKLGHVDVELARRLIRAQDEDASSVRKLASKSELPFSADSALLVTADPFRILTVYDIFNQAFGSGRSGTELTVSDMGSDVERFVKLNVAEARGFIGHGGSYLVIGDNNTLKGIGLCLGLDDSRRGGVYVESDKLDAQKTLTPDTFVISVLNDDRLIERLGSAKTGGLIKDFRVMT